jgi:hypothetical protein
MRWLKIAMVQPDAALPPPLAASASSAGSGMAQLRRILGDVGTLRQILKHSRRSLQHLQHAVPGTREPPQEWLSPLARLCHKDRILTLQRPHSPLPRSPGSAPPLIAGVECSVTIIASNDPLRAVAAYHRPSNSRFCGRSGITELRFLQAFQDLDCSVSQSRARTSG